MTMSPRAPVLVGAAALWQREDDPLRAAEPLALMGAALERAAADARAPELLARADTICALRGFWTYPDPCRLLADRFGATGARTVVSEIGVLQTTPFARAASAIAAGEADVVLITAAEARYREVRALRAGVEAPLTAQRPTEPDTVLRAQGDILSNLELELGVAMPVTQYAMIENALRAASGQTLDEHRRTVAELWARFSRIAAGNPDAWSRTPVEADFLREPSERNPMLAFPYTRLHTSQWNVDQACGFVLCSAETASAAGVPRDLWVFPHAIAESDYMLPLTERPDIHRSPGFEHAGHAALEHAGWHVDDVDCIELYSCFPAAVRVQMRELGIAADREVTVTGGMTFAGGPLNSFLPQALVRVVEALRTGTGDRAMATAISGFVTKQGVSLWSREPCAGGFAWKDQTAAVAGATTPVEVVAPGEVDGHATVISYTVAYGQSVPPMAIFVGELPRKSRTLITTTDPDVIARATTEEMCGRRITIRAGRVAAIGSSR